MTVLPCGNMHDRGFDFQYTLSSKYASRSQDMVQAKVYKVGPEISMELPELRIALYAFV